MAESQHATIVGGRGFIGSALVRQLRSEGWTCNIIARGEALPIEAGHLGTVFYCAGLTADYLLRPFDTVEAHVCMLAKVLQTTAFDRLVYMSSTRLYDGLDSQQQGREASSFLVDPAFPRHLYDLTKLTGEALCHAVAPERAAVVRLSSVYSEHGNTDGFMGPLLSKVASMPRGSSVVVDSSPYFSRDYIHIDDVVQIVCAVARRGRLNCYNVASGINLRNEELASILLRRTGRRLEFMKDSQVPPLPTIDVQSVRNDLGLAPRSLDTALHDWFAQLD